VGTAFSSPTVTIGLGRCAHAACFPCSFCHAAESLLWPLASLLVLSKTGEPCGWVRPSTLPPTMQAQPVSHSLGCRVTRVAAFHGHHRENYWLCCLQWLSDERQARDAQSPAGTLLPFAATKFSDICTKSLPAFLMLLLLLLLLRSLLCCCCCCRCIAVAAAVAAAGGPSLPSHAFSTNLMSCSNVPARIQCVQEGLQLGSLLDSEHTSKHQSFLYALYACWHIAAGHQVRGESMGWQRRPSSLSAPAQPCSSARLSGRTCRHTSCCQCAGLCSTQCMPPCSWHVACTLA
jgi:hypothetical protein